jgi:hypothetical protein
VRRAFRPAFFVLLFTACLAAGVEGLAWLIAPAWPSWALREQPVTAENIVQWQAGMPEVTFALNGWQMRDHERQVAKPAGVAFRCLFVGDSVLDGTFSRAAVPARVEGLLLEAGQGGIEAVNLGVTGTGPAEYYARLRDIALKLSPDAIVLMFFSGNDFPGRPFQPDQDADAPLIDGLAPHAHWLLRRMLGRTGGAGAAAGEQRLIDDASRRPKDERVAILADYMKTHYFPSLEVARIRHILERADERFWSAFAPRRFDREFLPAANLAQMISTEVGTDKVPLTPDEAKAAVSASEIDAARSWLIAMQRLAVARKVPFVVALAPTATVDPQFVEFWKAWPRYASYSLKGDADHQALAAALAGTGMRVVDLREDLDGVRGAYRKTDMHWTERGNEIVAARLAKEVGALRH